MYNKIVKRTLDIVFSLCGLMVFSPLFLIIAILIRVKLGSPIIFSQKRAGKNEEIFLLYKFRTMTDEKDEKNNLLPDEYRLTKFGRFLRSTSIDELPELWNILKGDMSLVGPRPLLERYLPYYTKKESKRHRVKPGLTGLAQVNGRSFITWEEIFEYDVYYVYNLSFLMDLRILLLTVSNVIGRKNVADVTQATTDEKGDLNFIIDGKKLVLHQPLDVERKEPKK